MSDVVLDVRDLRAWYGTEGDPVRAVDGVSFEKIGRASCRERV